jgi:hypothetical protein
VDGKKAVSPVESGVYADSAREDKCLLSRQ